MARKLGVQRHDELAMGAIATGGARTLNLDVIECLRIPDEVIQEVAEREERELERRERLFRDSRPARSPRDRLTILVDDGLATGSSNGPPRSQCASDSRPRLSWPSFPILARRSRNKSIRSVYEGVWSWSSFVDQNLKILPGRSISLTLSHVHHNL
ncbi:MAG: hypothetical protein J2P21_18910 [Chloracidobacterium sp.]|nr:hypothetical protein [Chloracidobacterium sp.]